MSMFGTFLDPDLRWDWSVGGRNGNQVSGGVKLSDFVQDPETCREPMQDKPK